ncbi:LysR family transcriptional regulator [Kocuria sp. NPDC057446]|uniref:LysR family transcriptional regulator n=1 Tax=Kocuria sp. NPDC057446 TaxID=3346137 RepID=UPI0036C2D110
MSAQLRNVDLNLLVALDALLTERSVTKAAQRQHIGQPAMSTALGRLRRMFDDPLLVRSGRGLTPTPLGESLEGPVRKLLADADALLAVRRRFDPTTDQRAFSVIASDYVALVLLRPLLRRLAVQAPNVRVHIRPVQEDYADQLRKGATDLVILPRDVLPTQLQFPHEPLFTDEYVCTVGTDHPTVGAEISLEQFQTEPYLAYNAGPLPSIAEQQLDALGISRNVEVTTQTFVLAPFLLYGTRLITLLHRRLVLSIQDQAGLRTVATPIPLRPIQELMVWTHAVQEDPGHIWLRQQVRQLADELDTSTALMDPIPD